MTREDIIRMARESGFDYSGMELTWESVICTEELERFANLVAEHEREYCANLCIELAPTNKIMTAYKVLHEASKIIKSGEQILAEKHMTELELLRSEVDKCHKIIESNLEMSKTLMAKRHELQRQIENQQRQWVGLTEQELLDIFAQLIAKPRSEYHVYKAYEKALKEKNT